MLANPATPQPQLLRYALLLVLFIAGIAAASSATAQVYTWKDKQGVIHYSSKPVSKDAALAELPEITRGEVKLTKRQVIGCDSHGGMNCGAGPDSDGSVICYDGFREATARFRFSCSAAKLEIADISAVTGCDGFTVMVRNSKAVAAHLVSATFIDFTGAKLKLSGPSEIEPFSMSEFKNVDSQKEKGDPSCLSSKPAPTKIEVNCGNC